jgi:hypothetical protein
VITTKVTKTTKYFRVLTVRYTLEKNIALVGSVRFDLRCEAYNLLNRTNFNIPALPWGRRTLESFRAPAPLAPFSWEQG